MNWIRSLLRQRTKTAILLAVLGLCRPGMAQQVSLALLPPRSMEPPAAAVVIKSTQTSAMPEAPGDHRFWDRENTFLFATSAAFSAADFVVTRDNLRAGGQELNPVVGVFGHSSAGLAMNFAGETMGMMGLSYFFHKTGHHKMERAVSMMNIGGSAAAVTFGMANR
ncbi:MAG: hypothetical protein ABSF93_02530 [Candidatus Sulfotelmatobacter sp.]